MEHNPLTYPPTKDPYFSTSHGKVVPVNPLTTWYCAQHELTFMGQVGYNYHLAVIPHEPLVEEIAEAPATAEQSFTSSEVLAAIPGLTYRQVDYWVRTDRVPGVSAHGEGSGTSRNFPIRALLHIHLMHSLIRFGFTLDKSFEIAAGGY
jgi:hypothetical protein